MNKTGVAKLLPAVIIGLSVQGMSFAAKGDCVLEFTSPENGAVVNSPNITVYGRGGADVEHGDQGSVSATLNGAVFFRTLGRLQRQQAFFKAVALLLP